MTHFETIKKHNEVMNKIAACARWKGLTVEKKRRVYHSDKQPFVPDLAINL